MNKTVYIHYGASEFDRDAFKPIRNGRIKMKILKYPDKIDPLKIINKSISVCPFCGNDNNTVAISTGYMMADKDGKHHCIRVWRNKYRWEKFLFRCLNDTVCKGCGAEFETDWVPYDTNFFISEVASKEILEKFGRNQND